MLCTISTTLYKLWLCPDYSSWILWKNLKKRHTHTQQILCFVTYRITSTSLHAKRPPDFLFASIVQILNENNCFICRTTQGRECHSSFVETGLCWWTCGKKKESKIYQKQWGPKDQVNLFWNLQNAKRIKVHPQDSPMTSTRYHCHYHFNKLYKWINAKKCFSTKSAFLHSFLWPNFSQ